MTTFFDRVLAAAREGEAWACARIYEDLRGPVMAYVLFRGASEPEDVTSEVFLHVFRDLDRFTGDAEGFRGWVFTIARHRLVDAWRTEGRRLPEAGLDQAVESEGGDAEEEAMAVLAATEIAPLLDQLTPDQRDVVLLRIVADLSLDEVATAMGRSVGSVKALQHRAMNALRRAMSGAPVTPSEQGAVS